MFMINMNIFNKNSNVYINMNINNENENAFINMNIYNKNKDECSQLILASRTRMFILNTGIQIQNKDGNIYN